MSTIVIVFPPQKLSKSKACADTGLLDSNLFQRCLQFFSSVAEFLLLTMQDRISPETGALVSSGSMMDQSVQLPLNPEKVPKVFASLPEWIIDDMADFLLFAMQ
jgi:ubiquitin conjugation factor E4 B